MEPLLLALLHWACRQVLGVERGELLYQELSPVAIAFFAKP